jgi:transposase
VLDGPINGEMLTAWVGQCLAPTLAPGDIVIADKLGSRKGLPARHFIRRAGAHLLFLPPYSPDLNPIEIVFAKLKTLFRKTDERTIKASWRRVGSLLDAFTP